MGNQTFAIIKPDAVKNKDTGLILDRVLKAGFKILAGKLAFKNNDKTSLRVISIPTRIEGSELGYVIANA